MRKVGAEIASGVAILVAFVIFIFGFLFLKNIAFYSDSYEVAILFNDVSGLEPGDFVSISGLRIGKVTSFELTNFKVLVGIEIGSENKIPKDSKALIKSLGMVGEKFIDIHPGISTDYLEDGGVMQGSIVGDLGDLGGSVEGLIQQAQEMLFQMKTAFENVFDVPTQRALRESLHHLRNISSKLDENGEHFERTLENLDNISTNMNEILAERRGKVEGAIDNIYQATTRFEHFANKLDSTLTSIQTILAKIESQEGAVGKLIYNDEFYNEMRHLTGELDTLVQDLKKHPQKYLDMGFIKVF